MPKVISSLVALFFVSLVVCAELPDGAVLIVHVRGFALPNGQFWLEVDPGPVATNGIRVYSEPSHTRLLMVIDNRFEKTTKGQEWTLRHHGEKTLEIREATTDLPEGMPRAQMSPRPATDDRITVWVNGAFLDGEREDMIAEAVVGSGDFNFSTYTSPEAPRDYWNCCRCADGSQMCWTCQQRPFNCCTSGNFCQINCPPQICEGSAPGKQPQISTEAGEP